MFQNLKKSSTSEEKKALEFRHRIRMENQEALKRTDKKQVEQMQQMFIEFMIRENKGQELKQVEDKNIPGTQF